MLSPETRDKPTIPDLLFQTPFPQQKVQKTTILDPMLNVDQVIHLGVQKEVWPLL